MKRIPFDFVLDELAALKPYTKPMFGCHAVYVGDKIILALRHKESSPQDNGVWVATTSEHHATLRRDLPGLRSIQIFGDGESGWQVLPLEHELFEENVIKLCAFILKADPRVGKIPKSRKKKGPAKKASPRKLLKKRR